MSILITSLDVSIFQPLWPLFLMCHCVALCVPKSKKVYIIFFEMLEPNFFCKFSPVCSALKGRLREFFLKKKCWNIFVTFFSSRLICKNFSNTWASVKYTTIIQFLTSCYVPHTFKMVVVISELLWYPHPQSTKAILKRHKTCQIPCKHFFFKLCHSSVISYSKKRSVQFASHFWNGVVKNLHSKLNGSKSLFHWKFRQI